MYRYYIFILVNLLLLIEFPRWSYIFAFEKSDVLLHQIVKALNNVIDQNYEKSDKVRINSIELLREQLLSNEKEGVGRTSIALSAKSNSIPGFPWGQILFSLVKIFKPQVVLELGTCIGISGAYFLAGLESNKNGKLYTVETLEPLLPFITRHFKALNYQRYTILLGDIQKVFEKNIPSLYPINIVFDDHIHEKEAVLRNFDQIYPYLADTAIYLFDDIFINDSMSSAWLAIMEDKRINITISLAMGLAYPHRPYRGCMPRIGIGIILKGSNLKKHFDIKIDNLVSGKRLAIKYGELVIG